MKKQSLLMYPNRVDSTYYTVSFSGGSWLTSAPLTNLRNPLLALVARSTNLNTSSTCFQVDMGAAVDVSAIAIPKSNVSRTGKVRVRASNTPGVFTTPLVDTDWQDWYSIIYPYGTIPYGHPSFWDGKIDEESAVGYPMPFLFMLDEAVNARYWFIEIDDPLNTDGYIDISRLFLSPAWKPSKGLQFGVTLGWNTATRRDESLDGARYFDVRPSRRRCVLTIRNLGVDEALIHPFEMLRRQGIHGQVFFVFDVTDTAHLHRRSFIATISEPSALEFPYVDLTSVALSLEEEI